MPFSSNWKKLTKKYLSFICIFQIDKAQQYISPDQIDDNHLIVEYGRKCLMYRKRLASSQDNDVSLFYRMV